MEVENLEVHKLTKIVQEQLGEDFAAKDAIIQGICEAMDRNAGRVRIMQAKAAKRKEQGKEPFPCFNAVCKDHTQEINSCNKTYMCYDCLFQMMSAPPNSLDYSVNEVITGEKMPSHQEALDILVENGLLKDESWEHDLENRYYREKKKPATQYKRDQVEIKNVTMSQFRAAVLQELEEFYTEHKTIIGDYDMPPIREDLDFKDEGDREIFANNLCISIEKIMGIYPNIRSIK